MCVVLSQQKKMALHDLSIALERLGPMGGRLHQLFYLAHWMHEGNSIEAIRQSVASAIADASRLIGMAEAMLDNYDHCEDGVGLDDRVRLADVAKVDKGVECEDPRAT